MSRIVFILGAGASVDAGAPLMPDFLDRARDWMDSEAGRADRDLFARVFRLISDLQSLQSKSTARLRDVEEVLALFEMGVLFNQIGPHDGRVAETAVNDMRWLIVRTIEASMRFPLEGTELKPPDTYQRFGHVIELLLQRRLSVSILSFNYDIGIDFGLTWNNVPVYYCLGDQVGQSNQVDLLKLHGAINLGRCAQCSTLDATHVSDWILTRQWPAPRNEHRSVRLEIGSTIGNCRCGGTRTPFIVPPTWNKGQHYEKIGVIWRHAARHLRDAEWIFVIGYSWPRTDQFFHYLYALGTSGPTLLRQFWLIDPDSRGTGIAERYREMLGEHARDRFVHHPTRFRDSLNLIACELGLGNIFSGLQATPRTWPESE